MTIRRTPADFIVEEALDATWLSTAMSGVPSIQGRFALYELEKTSLSTPEAVNQFAREIGVPPARIEYAGLKDKHARTRQHVTVRLDGSGSVPPERVYGGTWSATFVQRIGRAAEAEAIAANRFEIVVRDLSPQASAEMLGRARMLALGDDSILIVNYFGDQRFGSARHGEGFAARALLRGEFERALRLLIATPARKDSGVRRQFTRLAAAKWGDWGALASELPRCPDRRSIETLAAGGDFRSAFGELPFELQQWCVEAYQSFLWNRSARAFVGELTRGHGIASDDPFGEMVFAVPRHVPPEHRRAIVPMLARDVELGGPVGAACETTLREEGIGLDDLQIPGLRRPAFRAADRELWAVAEEFELSPDEPDEMSNPATRRRRTVSFRLPRGAYATVVLRALGQ